MTGEGTLPPPPGISGVIDHDRCGLNIVGFANKSGAKETVTGMWWRRVRGAVRGGGVMLAAALWRGGYFWS